jgi:hypothetical protein
MMRQSLLLMDKTSVISAYKEAKKKQMEDVSEMCEAMFPMLDVNFPHEKAIKEQIIACADLKKALILREKYIPLIFDERTRMAPSIDVRPDYDNLSGGWNH